MQQEAAALEWLDDVALFHRKGPSSCIASHMALPLMSRLHSSLRLAREAHAQVGSPGDQLRLRCGFASGLCCCRCWQAADSRGRGGLPAEADVLPVAV